MRINRTNYEDFLIQKLEGLLSTEQNAELDLFLHSNADIKSEWEAFEQTVVVPDESIVYEHKELLKKKTGGVIPMYRTMLYVASIAASLLLVFFVSQKYLFNNTNQSAVGNSQLAVLNNQPAVNTVTPSGSQLTVGSSQLADNNYPTKTQSTFSKPVSTKNYQIVNVNQPETQNPKLETIDYMKSLAPTAMKTYPRVSYASFIWTKGLKTPHAPARNVSEAGAWLQVASILGSEVMRLTGRGEWVNKAPVELQIKKPVEVNIHNAYINFHKILSFHSKKNNNK